MYKGMKYMATIAQRIRERKEMFKVLTLSIKPYSIK